MRKMIIAPHVDDEVLGCGGILTEGCIVVHCGLAENQKHGNKNFSRKERLNEFEEVKNATGCTSILLSHPVNSFACANLINDLEKVINKQRPDIIFMPSASYNQDHREVYEASVIALRPHDINYFVKRVVMYEQPQDFWNGKDSGIQPNYFVPIDIEKKINLYTMLKSQVRKHRSPEMLRDLARMRGHQSNVDFAEAFQIIRWVE